MSSKHEKDKQKALQEKYQAILYGLLRDEDNKYCVDCDAKGPRWASWNLGVFLCIRCAGIHRNLGVHVSRVKSVNLDAWTEEQVAMMKEIGNSRGRAVYEANIPDNFRRPQTDSSLETFIRAKYEQKKYIASEWVPPKPKALVLSTDNIPSKAAHNSTGIRDLRGSTKLATSQAKPFDTPKITSSVCVTPTPIAEKAVQEAKNGEVDLLGLDDPLPVGENSCQKDIFGEFLSNTQQQPQTQPTQQTVAAADPSPLAGPSQPNSINPNDTSLFDGASSATSTPSENKKVSKDAILALYGPPQAPGPAMYGGGLMMDPNQSMMGHMALLQGQPINGQIPLQSSMMIGQPAMMGGVSMAAMMNPQVPLLMGGGPQLQGQLNPNLYNIQQIQNQMVGLNLTSPHQTQPAFYQQQQQPAAAQPGFYQASLPGQQFFQQPQQNSNMFQSSTQQGALSYPGNTSLAMGVGAIPNARPSPAQVPGWSNRLPPLPAQPPMTGNFWQ